MHRKWIITLSILAAVALAAVLIARPSGTTIAKSVEQTPLEKAAHETPGEANPEAAALEPCEHGMAMYLCDECRYEAGIVRIPDTLLASGKNSGLVHLIHVSSQSANAVLEATGEIQLNRNTTARLGSAIPGVIFSIAVDLGQRVKKGETLLTVQSAELGRAVSDYQKNLSLMRLSEKNYERERSLFERRISSELDMTEKQMEFEEKRAELDAAEQALLAFGLSDADIAGLAAGKRAGFLPVRAPFSGIVIEQNASVGERVEPGNAVIVLSDPATVTVWADVYERDLSRLLAARKSGDIPANIQVKAFPGRHFSGIVDHIGATINESTRTVKVRVSVKNPDQLLRAGMFCTITITLGNTGGRTSVIPGTALLSDAGNDFVFAKWKDGYFIRKPVKKGRDMSGYVEILEGLAPGETIISDGAFLLKSDVLREKMGAGCAD